MVEYILAMIMELDLAMVAVEDQTFRLLLLAMVG